MQTARRLQENDDDDKVPVDYNALALQVAQMQVELTMVVKAELERMKSTNV